MKDGGIRFTRKGKIVSLPALPPTLSAHLSPADWNTIALAQLFARASLSIVFLMLIHRLRAHSLHSIHIPPCLIAGVVAARSYACLRLPSRAGDRAVVRAPPQSRDRGRSDGAIDVMLEA